MWETLGEVAAKLALFSPDHAGSDVDLLTEVFGRTRYVYLRRDDVVAQAVSLLRAEQTNVWHKTAQDQQEPQAAPRYDFDLIHERVTMIEQHNTAWRQWCATRELATAPIPVARGVLGVLGLDLPPGQEIAVRNKRLNSLQGSWHRCASHAG